MSRRARPGFALYDRVLNEYRPTRRELVGAAAAVSLLRPGIALAGTRTPTVFSRPVGRLAGSSAELPVSWPFVLAGVQWSGAAGARIELRARARDGRWSRWALVSTLGHDADGEGRRESAHGGEDGPRLYGEPVWFGVADRFQLRASEPVHGVRVHFVSAQGVAAAAGPEAARLASATGNAGAAAAFPLAQPILDAGSGQPPIIARSVWAGDHAPPAVPPGYGDVRLAFVHHTDNPNGYGAGEVPAMLLAIYDYHRYVRGWNDIGYNFVIDEFGRIWEARDGGIDQAVVGAQAGGYNLESTGVAVLGTFTYVVPPPATIDALQRLLAWKLSLHGVPTFGQVTVEVNPSDAFYTAFAPGAHISLPRVAGHRQGCTTDCPGDAFFARLPAIRPVVRKLAGRPAAVTLELSGKGVKRASYLMLASAEPGAGVPYTVSGRLAILGGAPIAGAPIEVQQLTSAGEHTVASATTTADGSWSAAFEPVHSVLLRALHRPFPATASPLVALSVPPAVTLSVAAGAPLTVTGTVLPHIGKVTIDAYATRHDRAKLAAHKVVDVKRGLFTSRLKLPRGRYEVVARTAPDARNAAGSSPPLIVTVPPTG